MCALFRVGHLDAKQNHKDAVFKQMCNYTIILNTPITNSYSIHANNHIRTGKEASTRRLTALSLFYTRNHKFKHTKNLQFLY